MNKQHEKKRDRKLEKDRARLYMRRRGTGNVSRSGP